MNNSNHNNDHNIYKQLQEEAVSTQKQRHISIEICQGPDCTGLGGGAASLEIEELVREYNGQLQKYCNHASMGSKFCDNMISIDVGGCREFCTVGPNVHIIEYSSGKKSCKSKRKKEILESMNHIDDILSCRGVVQSAIHLTGNNIDNKECSNEIEGLSCAPKEHKSMMERRAERIRWESLKHAYRSIVRCKKELISTDKYSPKSVVKSLTRAREKCLEHLSLGKDAELSALRNTEKNAEQVNRRADNFIRIIDEKLQSCFRNDQDEDDFTDKIFN